MCGRRQLSPSEFLFDPSLLRGLEWEYMKGKLSPPVTNEETGDTWLVVRPLHLTDYERGYLHLLSQLTVVGDVTKTSFQNQFWNMQKSGGYYITVIEDTRSNQIIGASTLITEYKFIHECGLRGRLEDVVVNNTYRGKQLGKLIVLTVTLLAKKLGCYKMSLDCKDPLVKFYTSIGYCMEPGNANSMIIRYDSSAKPVKNPS